MLASAWKLKLGDKALEVGVILVLVHHCCLHPGEPIQITREDLSPDCSARIHLVVIIRPPPETSQALKIGEYDVTILVD